MLTAGGLIAIENIREGDRVLATDPDTRECIEKTVLETYVREVSRLVHLQIHGEEVITTSDHPFYVNGCGFLNAGELYVGAKMVTANEEIHQVEQVSLEIVQEPQKVYHFQVEDFHTYHVGAEGVLVHNASEEYGGGVAKTQVEVSEGGSDSVKNIQSKSPQQLIADGWEDVTNPKMAANTTSRELYDPQSGLKIRFDKGVEGANGFEAVDHYHVMNQNYTNKKVDYYLDIDGNPVGKGSKASHILIKAC